MTIDIDTREAVLRLVREDSEFRRTIQREILTTELLEMPERLNTLTAVTGNLADATAALLEHTNVTNVRLGIIEADITEMKGDISELQDDMKVMKADITEMKGDISELQGDMKVMKADITEMKGDISEIKTNIDGLGESFRKEVRAQSSYRGAYAERAAKLNDLDIASLFADKHGLKRIDTMQVSRGVLIRWLRDRVEAVEALDLRPRAWRTFLRPDIIAEVRDLFAADDSTPAYYITVEASYTGDEEDIRRVTDHAKILRAVTGAQAYPVVTLVELDDKMSQEMLNRLYDDIEQFVEADDEDAALLYWLDSADLRPPEPDQDE